MIHNDLKLLPTLLFMACLAAAAPVLDLKESPAMAIAFTAAGVLLGIPACLFTARTRAFRGIVASIVLVAGLVAPVVILGMRSEASNGWPFGGFLLSELVTAIPMFAVCTACVVAAGMQLRKIFLALCAAIAVMVLPVFAYILLGAVLGPEAIGGPASAAGVRIVLVIAIFALVVRIGKNYELVPGGGSRMGGPDMDIMRSGF